MLNQWFFLLLALIAGAILPVQAAVNNKLAVHMQFPVLAALFSFLVGTMALLAYILLSGTPVSELFSAKSAPPHTWTGGLYGAFFVTSVIALVPRLGVALTFSIIVAGQMLATLPIDHYGLWGTPVKTINLPRLLGVLMVIGGVILVRRF